jgi:transcriptional regulator with XRE-family HTH domain
MADQNLGRFLRAARDAKALSLRDVERSTEISNAYLSQVESGRIKEPSPNVLFKLAELYQVDYAEVMDLAGYPSPKLGRRKTEGALSRLGPITAEEAGQLSEYLAFLRGRRRG